MSEEFNDSHKAHRKRQSGRKSQKKKQKTDFVAEETKKLKSNEKTAANLNESNHRNPKAFTFHSAKRAERSVRRAADLVEKKTHIPLVDRTPLEPPPFVVAVVGPPKVGKTLLLRSLVKNFTRQTLTNINGPVTVISGKKRRLTLIECNNDINCMIDVAKIADLVLLLIDASFGFEMETFEFLNICQVHGMPRIMGVLTHLDLIKNSTKLKKVKKELKHRFWTEVYQGSKLFYLSKLINEQYLKNEVKNLARFISVMKFRPLTWRTSHPYVVVDRIEDITDPEQIRNNSKCDRSVCVYGYVRGTHMKNRCAVHIPGIGDTRVTEINFLPDPCPLPDREKRRSLNEKEKLIYAPFSGVGGIVYDKDAVYIDLGGSHSHRTTDEGPQNELVSSIIKSDVNMEEKIAQSQLSLFEKSQPLLDDYEEDEVMTSSSDFDDDEGNDESGFEDEEDENEQDVDSDDETGIKRRKLSKNDDDEKINDSGIRWKSDLFTKASTSFQERRRARTNWTRIVYGQQLNEDEQADTSKNDDDDEVGGLFKVAKKLSSSVEERNQIKINDKEDRNRFESSKDWNSDEALDDIRDCFVTGKWADDENAETLLNNENEDEEEDDDEIYGDFEDLETGVVVKNEEDAKEDEKNKEKSEINEETNKAVVRREKKRKLKQMFDAEYDEGSKFYNDLKEEFDQQAQLNKNEFEKLDDSSRVQYEGFRPGMYVRIEISSMPCEFVVNFDPNYPCLVGGLLNGEENIGCLQVRVKKHRWHKRILKSRDPLIISLGWRRFQTMPLYSIQDHNMRNRYLKYTPEHLFCHALFWGPITPQNTGFLAVQNVAEVTKEFRIAASGVVLNLDKSVQIVKKLKLVGTPFKIFKKSAFIENMFTSSLEVAKFQGASLRTVSGIRGQIKRPLSKPTGAFRATFEDKILMKDICFVRTWYPLDVPKFYTPVTNLLMNGEEKSKWRGARTVGQMRFELGLKPPQKEDSIYKKVERKIVADEPLLIPKKLQKELPYALKPKNEPPPSKIVAGKRKNDGKLVEKHTALILEPHESKIMELMKMLKTVHEDKVEKNRQATDERVKKHKKQLELVEEKRKLRQKNSTKRICKMLSQMEKRKLRAVGGKRRR